MRTAATTSHVPAWKSGDHAGAPAKGVMRPVPRGKSSSAGTSRVMTSQPISAANGAIRRTAIMRSRRAGRSSASQRSTINGPQAASMAVSGPSNAVAMISRTRLAPSHIPSLSLSLQLAAIPARSAIRQ